MNERLGQDGEEKEDFVAPDNSGAERSEIVEDTDTLERKASALWTAVNALENRNKENLRLGARRDDEYENLRNELKERYDKIQYDLKNNPNYQEKIKQRNEKLENEKNIRSYTPTAEEQKLVQERDRIWNEYQKESMGGDKKETDRLRQELDKIDNRLKPTKNDREEHERELNDQISGR